MASNRRRARRLTVWIAYRNRCDRLVGDQRRRYGDHPMRTTPGFFRAEGWNTDGPRWNSLRHGA